MMMTMTMIVRTTMVMMMISIMMITKIFGDHHRHDNADTVNDVGSHVCVLRCVFSSKGIVLHDISFSLYARLTRMIDVPRLCLCLCGGLAALLNRRI